MSQIAKIPARSFLGLLRKNGMPTVIQPRTSPKTKGWKQEISRDAVQFCFFNGA